MKKQLTSAKSIFILVACVFSIGIAQVYSHSPVRGTLRFTENKGQWQDVITYRADVPGGSLFLEKKGFTYAFINANDIREIHPPKKEMPAGGYIIHMHSVKVQFINALEPTAMEGEDAESSFSNYFLGNDPARWASNVKSFEKVEYTSLYTGVDLKVYSNYSSLKYDFIIAAGADANQIQLKYEGADALQLTEDGNFSVHTSVGNFTEQKPYAYQLIDGKEKEVRCNYALNENVLSFTFPDGYDKGYELIIDPTLIFSTLTGSTADNWGNTATYDDQGNLYTGGIAFAAGYPVTTGAYKTTFQGGGTGGGNGYTMGDVSITKYNSAGTARLYSTYLGGTDGEQPTSLVVNTDGELIILGKTYSTNFPTTVGAYDRTANGGSDIFIAKLNAAGSALVSSTYIGGSSDDGVNISSIWGTITFLKYSYCDDMRSEVYVDDSGYVYVADNSQSTNFPIVNGFQASRKGAQDGVVFKMNGTLTSLSWSTYLGGSAYDGAYSLVVDNGKNVLVTGGTTSTDFPATAGAYHTTNSGGVDGYIAKIAPDGKSLIRATYLGTSSYDQSLLIQTDVFDNAYVVGQTEGVYPVTSGVYSNPNSSQFIHKLDSTLSTTIYSTVFGSGQLIGNISITAFLIDICENIYVAGWGRKGFDPYPITSVTGMPVTPNAYQSNPHDGNDFYFMQLDKDAQSLWYATYFGGATSADHVDGGTSRFDKNGVIYQSVCAACGGYVNDFPTTPGVVSTTNNSSNCNNGSIKMHFDIISESCLTGTKDKNLMNGEIQIYPNPARNQFMVYDSRFLVGEKTVIDMFNVLGENVYTEIITSNRVTITQDLNPGIYFVKLSSSTKQVVEKLIIK